MSEIFSCIEDFFTGVPKIIELTYDDTDVILRVTHQADVIGYEVQQAKKKTVSKVSLFIIVIYSFLTDDTLVLEPILLLESYSFCQAPFRQPYVTII